MQLNKMDNRNQVIKLCGVCGNERVCNDYHRIYNPCKTCAAKNSARRYEANRDKKLQDLNYIKRTKSV